MKCSVVFLRPQFSTFQKSSVMNSCLPPLELESPLHLPPPPRSPQDLGLDEGVPLLGDLPGRICIH